MLQVRDLTVVYPTAGSRPPALRNVTLEVKAGEIVGLIGPNGAGKSTLMRAVSGVLAPRSGEINVGGSDIRRLSVSQRARLLAVVPQARQMGGAFTVEQAVMMGRTAYMGWLGR
ncbi:MAG: ABC transporter ATP-binding protein, partial [Anaerolineaceae bacterium]